MTAMVIIVTTVITHTAKDFLVVKKGHFLVSFYFAWSGIRGSNSLPEPWQGSALPDELIPHIVIYQQGQFLSLFPITIS